MNTLPAPSTASPVKHTVPATNARWSRAWPGTATVVSGPTTSPSASRRSTSPRAAATGAAPARARSAPTASAWSAWSWVSAIPPRPPRAATSAATAATCSSSAGPGSTTNAGSRPTTQVLVPSRVSGPGLSARTRATSWPATASAAIALRGRAGTPARGARWRRPGAARPRRTTTGGAPWAPPSGHSTLRPPAGGWSSRSPGRSRHRGSSRRHGVAAARPGVDPQDLAEQAPQVLGVPAGAVLVVRAAAVAQADVELAVGPEQDQPAVVVGLGLALEEHEALAGADRRVGVPR